MRKLLLFVVIAVAGYFAWQRLGTGGPPRPIENPVYGEVRVTANVQNRDIEMALFYRAASDDDCHGRANRAWNKALDACPSCKMEPVKCQAKLPPRYARLFDDVPIPSAYLSATAGRGDERDGRIVVYGLTDEEGRMVCEGMRTAVLKEYTGDVHCVAASGR